MLEWKGDNTGKVLEVSGARQAGKTYILKKFADENFKDTFYINMAEISGEWFLRCSGSGRELDSPWFASYEKTKGELYFYVRSIKDYKNYGVEVKSGDAQAKTARALFNARKLDHVYYLKGGSSGGVAVDGHLLTVSFCLAERIKFDLGIIR